MNETKSWLFEKISKIDLKKGGGGQINIIRNGKGEVTTSSTELHRTLVITVNNPMSI